MVNMGTKDSGVVTTYKDGSSSFRGDYQGEQYRVFTSKRYTTQYDQKYSVTKYNQMAHKVTYKKGKAPKSTPGQKYISESTKGHKMAEIETTYKPGTNVVETVKITYANGVVEYRGFKNKNSGKTGTTFYQKGNKPKPGDAPWKPITPHGDPKWGLDGRDGRKGKVTHGDPPHNAGPYRPIKSPPKARSPPRVFAGPYVPHGNPKPFPMPGSSVYGNKSKNTWGMNTPKNTRNPNVGIPVSNTLSFTMRGKDPQVNQRRRTQSSGINIFGSSNRRNSGNDLIFGTQSKPKTAKRKSLKRKAVKRKPLKRKTAKRKKIKRRVGSKRQSTAKKQGISIW